VRVCQWSLTDPQRSVVTVCEDDRLRGLSRRPRAISGEDP
jgi:hypothetical protein